MKIRKDFVTNSSSSSFIISRKNYSKIDLEIQQHINNYGKILSYDELISFLNENIFKSKDVWCKETRKEGLIKIIGPQTLSEFKKNTFFKDQLFYLFSLDDHGTTNITDHDLEETGEYLVYINGH